MSTLDVEMRFLIPSSVVKLFKYICNVNVIDFEILFNITKVFWIHVFKIGELLVFLTDKHKKKIRLVSPHVELLKFVVLYNKVTHNGSTNFMRH